MKLLHRYLIALLIVLALAACQAGDGALPTPGADQADFMTATPGGSISVSLLDPTSVPVLLEDPGVVPAATETADPVSQSAAECPVSTGASLPQIPPSVSQLNTVIATYLGDGGLPADLEARLREWNMINANGGMVVTDRDFTGDGVPEVLVAVLDPTNDDLYPQPGDLFLLGCSGGDYVIRYQAGYAVDAGAPYVVSADDMTGDGISDLAFLAQSCGTSTCTTAVSIIGWNPETNAFKRLLPTEISAPFADVTVGDTNGDGLRELVVVSGTVVASEAGPLRRRTEVYSYDAVQGAFVLTDQQLGEAIYRIHVLHDADAAFAARDFPAAIALYEQAATDSRLSTWGYPNENAQLAAYARFRQMVAEGLSDNNVAGQTTFEALIAEYGLPATAIPAGGAPAITLPTSIALDETRPGVGFVHLAAAFWEGWLETRNEVTACNAVVDYARSRPTSYEVLNSFGFANRDYTPQDLCPFGS